MFLFFTVFALEIYFGKEREEEKRRKEQRDMNDKEETSRPAPWKTDDGQWTTADAHAIRTHTKTEA